jgi:hypothetical protein
MESATKNHKDYCSRLTDVQQKNQIEPIFGISLSGWGLNF